MKKPVSSKCAIGSRQRGAVLIVALVLLLILTVLGTAGIQNTLITERMAGNYRDLAVAFESAESGLRSGERVIGPVSQASLNALYSFDGTDGTWTVDDDTESKSPEDTTYAINTGVSEVPPDASTVSAYFIEKIVVPSNLVPGESVVLGTQEGQRNPFEYYRVTSRGVGVSPTAEIILQSTYYKGQ